MIPPAILNAPTPSRDDAQRELIRISARAHGIGTVTDLADYFRLKNAEARARILELVESNELREVSVEGWRRPASSTLTRRSRAA